MGHNQVQNLSRQNLWYLKLTNNPIWLYTLSYRPTGLSVSSFRHTEVKIWPSGPIGVATLSPELSEALPMLWLSIVTSPMLCLSVMFLPMTSWLSFGGRVHPEGSAWGPALGHWFNSLKLKWRQLCSKPMHTDSVVEWQPDDLWIAFQVLFPQS